MNKLEHPKLVFIVFFARIQVRLGAHDKKQTGISTVNHLVAAVFEKGTLQFGTAETFSDNFRLQSCSLVHGDPLVVRGEAGLPLLVSVKRNTSQEKKNKSHEQESRRAPNFLRIQYFAQADELSVVEERGLSEEKCFDSSVTRYTLHWIGQHFLLTYTMRTKEIIFSLNTTTTAF